MSNRPWTRIGTVAFAAHVFYELGSGVAMPLATRRGIWPTVAMHAGAMALAYRSAGRQPASRDRVFAVLNGLFISAVTAHFVSWPRTTVAGLPWLTECEGLRGRLIAPYNLILYASAAAAAGGLMENRRALAWGLAMPGVAVPVLVWGTPREYARLLAIAHERPRWWNRRLQERIPEAPADSKGYGQPSPSR